MQKNVDLYFVDGCLRCKLGATPACKVNTWREVLEALRTLVLESGLEESCKWGMPCYTYNGKNVAMIAAFKEYCSLNLFKGVLLKDPKQLLTAAGEDSQSYRQLRLTTVKEVIKYKTAIRTFLKEAIELEKAGKKVEFKKIDEHPVPEELLARFKKQPALEKAFKALTPGRQRGYLIHISQAKQEATRLARIERRAPSILKGKGLNE